MNEKLRISNDALYLDIPRPELGNNVWETHLIMTKEMFMICYDVWIKENKDDNKQDKSRNVLH